MRADYATKAPAREALVAVVFQLFGVIARRSRRLSWSTASMLRAAAQGLDAQRPWLLDDRVDDLELQKIGSGHAHRGGGEVALAAVFPEDARAALGRDDAVGSIFEHVHAVGDAEGQRAAAPPSPMMVAMMGTCARDMAKSTANGLALPALLGADARIRARRVDEGEHGEPEAVGQLVEAARFAVSLGVRLAEVARDLLLGGAPLLMPTTTTLRPR